MHVALRGGILAALLILAPVLGAAPPSQASRTPKEASMALLQIIHRQDWRELISTCAFSEKVTDTLVGVNPDSFAESVWKGIDTGGGRQTVLEVCGGMADLAVGEAEVHGDQATVPTSCVLNLKGKPPIPFRGVARLIRRDRAWKWDLSFSDKPDEAVSKALLDLLGKPVEAKP